MGWGGRFAGSVAGTPFALSRGRAVFRHSQNGRHPHQAGPASTRGCTESTNFLRPVLFLLASFVRRSFVIRYYTPSRRPVLRPLSTLYRRPHGRSIPLYFPFSTTILATLPSTGTAYSAPLAATRNRPLSFHPFTHPLPSLHTPLPILSFPPFGRPLSLSPFFTASVFRLFHPRHRFHPSSRHPVQRQLRDFISPSLSLCSSHPLRSSPLPLSLFPNHRRPLRRYHPPPPSLLPPVGLARIYTSARCSRRGRARILLRRTRMKFITNYGKSLDDRRAVRRPETHEGGPRWLDRNTR